MYNVRITDSIQSSDLMIGFYFESQNEANSFADGLALSVRNAALEYRFDWFSLIREPDLLAPDAGGVYYTLTLRRWYSATQRNLLNWRPFVEREVRDNIHPMCGWLDLLLEGSRRPPARWENSPFEPVAGESDEEVRRALQGCSIFGANDDFYKTH
jgi:hypothetical protein